MNSKLTALPQRWWNCHKSVGVHANLRAVYAKMIQLKFRTKQNTSISCQMLYHSIWYDIMIDNDKIKWQDVITSVYISYKYHSYIYIFLYRDTYPLSPIYIHIFFRKKNPRTFFETVKNLRRVSLRRPQGQCCHLLLVRTCHCGQSSPDGRSPKKKERMESWTKHPLKKVQTLWKLREGNLRIMIPKKHILQYLEVDFNILPMISTIYDQLKIHTMECLRPQRWSGGTGGTEVPPA